MTGKCFGVVDTIADKVVVYFHAANEADARRFVRSNFGTATGSMLEGLEVRLLIDWDKYSVGEVISPVVDWLPPPEPAL